MKQYVERSPGTASLLNGVLFHAPERTIQSRTVTWTAGLHGASEMAMRVSLVSINFPWFICPPVPTSVTR